MDNSYLTTVNKFYLCSCDNVNCALNRRTQVDEARHTRTEYHTSSTLQKKTAWQSIHAYFLCPHDPPPTTQSRQEHVKRARRTRKDCSAATSADMLEGVDRMNRRKCKHA